MHNPVTSLYRYITVVIVIGVFMLLTSILHKMIESLRTDYSIGSPSVAMLFLFKTVNDCDHLWSSVADPILSTLHCYPMSSSLESCETGPV